MGKNIMNIKHIEDLLDKYFEAETTLEQEKELREFYLDNRFSELPDTLSQYKELFLAISEEIPSDSVNNETKPVYVKQGFRRALYITLPLAAAAALAVFFILNSGVVNSKDLNIHLVCYGEVIVDNDRALDFADSKLKKIRDAFELEKISNDLQKMDIDISSLNTAATKLESVNNRVESIINKIK